MIKPRRVGHATFETTDIEKQIAYWTEVAGLVLAEREKKRAFLASKTGLLSIQLEETDRNHCARLSFEVAPDSDFDAPRQGTGQGRDQERAAQRLDPRHRQGADLQGQQGHLPSTCSPTGNISARTTRSAASARSSSATSPSIVPT